MIEWINNILKKKDTTSSKDSGEIKYRLSLEEATGRIPGRSDEYDYFKVYKVDLKTGEKEQVIEEKDVNIILFSSVLLETGNANTSKYYNDIILSSDSSFYSWDSSTGLLLIYNNLNAINSLKSNLYIFIMCSECYPVVYLNCKIIGAAGGNLY